jgi:hypothetical protein
MRAAVRHSESGMPAAITCFEPRSALRHSRSGSGYLWHLRAQCLSGAPVPMFYFERVLLAAQRASSSSAAPDEEPGSDEYRRPLRTPSDAG